MALIGSVQPANINPTGIPTTPSTSPIVAMLDLLNCAGAAPGLTVRISGAGETGSTVSGTIGDSGGITDSKYGDGGGIGDAEI